jgi:Alcohol dehydrogenase GroES-like domain
VVSTLSVLHAVLGFGSTTTIDRFTAAAGRQRTAERLEVAEQSVRTAHAAGLAIAAGSDFGGGSVRAGHLAWEVECLVRAGLEPWEALGAATRIEELPEPEPGADEVKVRVRACSLCGTDLKIFRHGHDRMTFPRVTGHEIAGEIAATGPDVTGWRPGERAQVVAAIPCGGCEDCRAGQLAVCSRGETMGRQRDGGFAEYVIVPAAAIAAGGINRIPHTSDMPPPR